MNIYVREDLGDQSTPIPLNGAASPGQPVSLVVMGSLFRLVRVTVSASPTTRRRLAATSGALWVWYRILTPLFVILPLVGVALFLIGIFAESEQQGRTLTLQGLLLNLCVAIASITCAVASKVIPARQYPRLTTPPPGRDHTRRWILLRDIETNNSLEDLARTHPEQLAIG